MSNILEGLLYSKEDEWIKVEGDTATIGITDYAQDALSDIVYLELPEEGDAFTEGETFGVVESVKAASDLYMPIDGTITESNEDLTDTPEDVNSDPYGKAWMIKVTLTNASQLDTLMDSAAYKAYCDERSG